MKQDWQKSPAGTRQTDSKNLVWFGEIERKLAKLSKTTFTYRSSSSLFYVFFIGKLPAELQPPVGDPAAISRQNYILPSLVYLLPVIALLGPVL